MPIKHVYLEYKNPNQGPFTYWITLPTPKKVYHHKHAFGNPIMTATHYIIENLPLHLIDFSWYQI